MIGCATLDSRMGQKMVRTELYFGSARTSGSPVSEKEWRAFLDTEITPRFPDGLTVIDGAGQWRTQYGELIRERSRVLVIIHSPTKDAHARIETLRGRYKQRFGQESVLKVATPVRASF